MRASYDHATDTLVIEFIRENPSRIVALEDGVSVGLDRDGELLHVWADRPRQRWGADSLASLETGLRRIPFVESEDSFRAQLERGILATGQHGSVVAVFFGDATPSPESAHVARFSTSGRRVIAFAGAEAERLAVLAVDVAHLFLGYLAFQRAGSPIHRLGIEVERIRAIVRQSGELAGGTRWRDLDPASVDVLTRATSEADRRQHTSVTSAHLLLALCDEPIVQSILDELNCPVPAVREIAERELVLRASELPPERVERYPEVFASLLRPDLDPIGRTVKVIPVVQKGAIGECEITISFVELHERGFTIVSLLRAPRPERLARRPGEMETSSWLSAPLFVSDDRGNSYLGHGGQSSSSGSHWAVARGDHPFLGPLDPGARALIIEIPFAGWTRRDAPGNLTFGPLVFRVPLE